MIGFLIKYRIPVSIFFFICQFIWMAGENSLVELDSISVTSGLCLLILVGFWIILLSDMIKMKILNKTFWLISMFVMPWLAPAVYLFQRKKLQRA